MSKLLLIFILLVSFGLVACQTDYLVIDTGNGGGNGSGGTLVKVVNQPNTQNMTFIEEYIAE